MFSLIGTFSCSSCFICFFHEALGSATAFFFFPLFWELAYLFLCNYFWITPPSIYHAPVLLGKPSLVFFPYRCLLSRKTRQTCLYTVIFRRLFQLAYGRNHHIYVPYTPYTHFSFSINNTLLSLLLQIAGKLSWITEFDVSFRKWHLTAVPAWKYWQVSFYVRFVYIRARGCL